MTTTAHPLVIPAQAGIHLATSACGTMDSRLRGNDEVGGTAEAQKLLGISFEGSVA